jgi:predicted ATP-grasp superfamily ATP-dependent carboligase
VIGIDVVSLAASARKAGYQVYAVDYFGDQDIKRLCRESRSIVKQRIGETCGKLDKDFSPEALLQLAKGLLRKVEIDAVLLSSGLDDSPGVLFELDDLIPILGNHPNAVKRVRDKMKFFQEIERLRIPHPETAMAENLEEARGEAKNIGYPVLVKPLRSFGGAGIRKAEGSEEIEQAFQDAALLDDKALIQEYIPGIAASASLISSTNRAVTLTLNEQLLGMSEMGQREPFGYCGNVVPLQVNEAVADRCKGIVKRVVSHFNLVGSNGIDFMISKEGVPHIIEVNPRFQGTLECVERTLNMSIVKAHVEACIQGKLPTLKKSPSAFCVRLILFAPQRSVVPNLSIFEEVRDIPLPEVIIEKGEPVCSIIIKEKTRNSAVKKARMRAKLIYGKTSAGNC